jgi:hypothetical protein
MAMRGINNAAQSQHNSKAAVSLGNEGYFFLAIAEENAAKKRKIYSNLSFSFASKVRMKIARILASEGNFEGAAEQCRLVSATNKHLGKSTDLPRAWESYYSGKAEEKTAETFQGALFENERKMHFKIAAGSFT